MASMEAVFPLSVDESQAYQRVQHWRRRCAMPAYIDVAAARNAHLPRGLLGEPGVQLVRWALSHPALVSAVLLAAGGAYAQDNMSKDAMGKSTMAQDGMAK